VCAMTAGGAVHLQLATREDLAGVHVLLMLLTFLAAALSPRPEWLLPLFTLAHIVIRMRTVACRRDPARYLSMRLSPDGRVHLFSAAGPVAEGRVGENHWCTPSIAVLDLRLGDRVFYGVVLARRQNGSDFRRLRVWVRQKILYNNA